MKLWPHQRTKSSTSELNDSASDRYGLKTWTEPSDPIVEIVFIHGLGGHRERTWSVKDGSGSWPLTLLAPKLPEARISTFGYDAKIFHVSKSSIGDHAKSLLFALAARREVDHTIDRPIIFVTHSLGGILCQDVLVASRASAEAYLGSIYRCTRGICFLGTPHQGSDLASSMSWLVTKIAYVRQANTRVAKVLRRDSEVLARIQQDFHSMLRARCNEGYPQVRIACFYEELALPLFGQLVPKTSAIMPSYPYTGIRSSHKGMVKFATDRDPGFVSISNELLRWVDGIRSDQAAAQLSAGPSRPEGPLGKSQGHGQPHAEWGIVIKGDVFQSSIVNGCQTIQGDLVIG